MRLSWRWLCAWELHDWEAIPGIPVRGRMFGQMRRCRRCGYILHT